MTHPPEPTAEDCSSGAELIHETQRAIALWYPQMGGYGGKAVVVVNDPSQLANTCVDVYVWHDGEFPFTGSPPVELHHCDAEQFVRFGQAVLAYQDKVREVK